MNVAELIAQLSALPGDMVVTVVDPHLHVDCRPVVSAAQWAVCIESTGSVVTEEDVS